MKNTAITTFSPCNTAAFWEIEGWGTAISLNSNKMQEGFCSSET
jgi:hypothetical protein